MFTLFSLWSLTAASGCLDHITGHNTYPGGSPFLEVFMAKWKCDPLAGIKSWSDWQVDVLPSQRTQNILILSFNATLTGIMSDYFGDWKELLAIVSVQFCMHQPMMIQLGWKSQNCVRHVRRETNFHDDQYKGRTVYRNRVMKPYNETVSPCIQRCHHCSPDRNSHSAIHIKILSIYVDARFPFEIEYTE